MSPKDWVQKERSKGPKVRVTEENAKAKATCVFFFKAKRVKCGPCRLACELARFFGNLGSSISFRSALGFGGSRAVDLRFPFVVLQSLVALTGRGSSISFRSALEFGGSHGPWFFAFV